MFEGFEEIFPDKKTGNGYGVNVLQDGIITVNGRLRERIGDKNVRFMINKSGDKIIIEPTREELGFRINKAGRFRNQGIVEKLKKQKMIFPVRYALVEKEGYFLGDFSGDYRKKMRDK